MFKLSHLLNPEETEGPADALIRVAKTLEQRALAQSSRRSLHCLTQPRLEQLASCAAAEPEEIYHLQHCRVCRIGLAAIEAEFEENMREQGTMGIRSMAMREGRTAPESLIAPLLAACRSAIRDTKTTWTIEGAWALLEQLRKHINALEALDVETRRQFAAEYADIVAKAPEPMKVVLTYGIIRLREAKRFAMTAAREIARRDDPVAHRVLAFVVRSEAKELASIDAQALHDANAEAAIAGYVARADAAIERFMQAVGLPHTLAEAWERIEEDAIALAAPLFASRAPVATVLHLLTLRYYLGTVADYLRYTYSDLLQDFPELSKKIHRCASEHRAALVLAMEATEKLLPACPVELLIRKIVDIVPPAKAAGRADEDDVRALG